MKKKTNWEQESRIRTLFLRAEKFFDVTNPMGFLIRFELSNLIKQINNKVEGKLSRSTSGGTRPIYDRQRAESSLSTVPPNFDINSAEKPTGAEKSVKRSAQARPSFIVSTGQ